MSVLYLAMFGSAANLVVAAVARLTCCWRSSGLRRYCWIALAKAAGSRWGTRIPASPLSRISRGAGGAFGGDDGYGAGLGFDEGVGESFVETGLDEDGGL